MSNGLLAGASWGVTRVVLWMVSNDTQVRTSPIITKNNFPCAQVCRHKQVRKEDTWVRTESLSDLSPKGAVKH